MSLSLSDLAARLGADPDGAPGDLRCAALAPPAAARPDELSFALRGGGDWRNSQAAAVLVSRAEVVPSGSPGVLRVDDVAVACARATAWLAVRRRAAARRSDAGLATSARIAPDAMVADGAVVGEGTVIESGAVVAASVVIGDHCRIGAGAIVSGLTEIGNRVEISAGAVIGEDGFAFVNDGVRWLRMPSFGGVLVGDDVCILARAVVHAGVLGDTVIEAGCLLDSQVLIGHDSRVGAGSAIAGHTALAGACVLGRECRIGGHVGIGEGVRIADRVTVTAMSMVTRALDRAGQRYSSGWPAEPSTTWWRRVGRLKRIVDTAKPGDDGQ